MRVVMISKALVVGRTSASSKRSPPTGCRADRRRASAWAASRDEPGLHQRLPFDRGADPLQRQLSPVLLPALGRILRQLRPDSSTSTRSRTTWRRSWPTARRGGRRPPAVLHLAEPLGAIRRRSAGSSATSTPAAYGIAGNAEAVDVLRAQGLRGADARSSRSSASIPTCSSRPPKNRGRAPGCPPSARSTVLEPHKGIDWLLEAGSGLSGDEHGVVRP